MTKNVHTHSTELHCSISVGRARVTGKDEGSGSQSEREEPLNDLNKNDGGRRLLATGIVGKKGLLLLDTPSFFVASSSSSERILCTKRCISPKEGSWILLMVSLKCFDSIIYSLMILVSLVYWHQSLFGWSVIGLGLHHLIRWYTTITYSENTVDKI